MKLMSGNLKLTICLGGLLAPWLLASASLPTVAGGLKLDHIVPMPIFQSGTQSGQQSVLRSFDISFVDPNSHTYALAASALFGSGTGPASQPGIVTYDTKNKGAANLLAVGQFAGSCSIPPARDHISGPNGLVIIGNEIWVGDGPIYTPSCVQAGTPTIPSNVKVLDFAGNIKKTISTGGIARADELCFNPFTNTVLIANDEPEDNFITFISTQTYAVLGSIKFDGKDQKGNNILANGIEQCAFNPRDKKFYLNIPATVVTTGTTTSAGPGLVLTISEHAPFHVERVFTIDPATGCKGPQGLAVGPSNQMALGCGGTNSLIINSTNGKLATTVTGEGGTDETWYNPTANQYYFARSTAGVLGVENAGPPANAASTNNTITGSGSHSVAADPNKDPGTKTSQVYVPIRSSTFTPVTTPPTPSPTICGSLLAGADANGCIAVFHAP
jgi:hypothetical protein